MPPAAWCAEGRSPDLTDYSLEQLLALEVSGASKFLQSAAEAPSSVSVITSADIRTFGYRTLADALRAVGGMYVQYDRSYSYLGVRGFARPGDFNSRILLLVDGYRVNDNIYDQAFLGREFPVDLDLVDRIEVVRGPGSAIYGSNALLAVINVITRRPADFGRLEASAEAGSRDSRKGRASLAGELENGAQLLVSASGFSSEGGDLFFPEAGQGHTRNTDYEDKRNFFGKFQLDSLSLQAVHSHRIKGLPGGFFGSVFDSPANRYVDDQNFLNLAWYTRPSETLEVSADLHYSRYDFTGDYLYPPPDGLFIDRGRGQWWGGDLRFRRTLGGGHKLIAGVEAQRNTRQDQFNPELDEPRKSHRSGIYVQDEYPFAAAWLLNAGARYDSYSLSRHALSPRLALIHGAQSNSVLKFMYGTAFRTPNVYEFFYHGSGSLANPELKPERVRTWEMVWEYQPADNSRVTVSGYRYRIDDLINQVTANADAEVQYRNLPRTRAAGLELEGEHWWQGGARLRAAASFQRSHATEGGELSSSPRRLAKFNWTVPFGIDGWRAGAEAQYTSGRLTELQGRVPGFWLANLTLLRTAPVRGWDISASIYNVFDRKYFDPAGQDQTVPDRDRMEQDGRAIRLKLQYRM